MALIRILNVFAKSTLDRVNGEWSMVNEEASLAIHHSQFTIHNILHVLSSIHSRKTYFHFRLSIQYVKFLKRGIKKTQGRIYLLSDSPAEGIYRLLFP
jgi:hypothetical protein